MIKLNEKFLSPFVRANEVAQMEAELEAARKTVMDKSGAGSDFLGWLDLPVDYDKEEFARIKTAAAKIQKSCDVLVVIGIGGSYLGARAAIEFVKSPVYNNKEGHPRRLLLRKLHKRIRTCRPSPHLRGTRRVHQRHLEIRRPPSLRSPSASSVSFSRRSTARTAHASAFS